MVDTEHIQSLACESGTGMVKKMIALRSDDGYDWEVEEAVALQMHLVSDMIRDSHEPLCRLPGITKNTLFKVIDYCRHHIEPYTPTMIESFDAEFVKQLNLLLLFNLIQAAHHLKIKSLMDLTCQTLVNMVKTKTFGEIVREFNIDQEYVQSFKDYIKSPPRGLLNALAVMKESLKVDRMLRQRGKETLIMEVDFLDLKFSPFVSSQLSFVDRRDKLFENYVRELLVSTGLKKLLEVITLLEDLIDGDLGLTGHLSSDAVQRLLQILNEYKGDRIQYQAVYILSRAKFDKCKDVMTNDAIPALVKHMSGSFYQLAFASVIALTRLADAYPGCREVILENGALEDTLKIIKECGNMYKIVCCVSKFLAVVCRCGIPLDKVEVARNISEELLQKKIDTSCHIKYACYALQYLTYEHHVAIGKSTLKTLIHFIGNFYGCENALAAGSALGVVGNIVRWGKTDDQIQIVSNVAARSETSIKCLIDCKLLGCLRRIMVCCKFKKFWMEACQIVSNVAARSETSIKDMDDEVDFVESLCSLLEKDESDVKMEAAWAIFNCIYGNKRRHIESIDDYSRAGAFVTKLCT